MLTSNQRIISEDVPITPQDWHFITFTYHGLKNIGTFHINHTFGYSAGGIAKSVSVSEESVVG